MNSPSNGAGVINRTEPSYNPLETGISSSRCETGGCRSAPGIEATDNVPAATVEDEEVGEIDDPGERKGKAQIKNVVIHDYHFLGNKGFRQDGCRL